MKHRIESILWYFSHFVMRHILLKLALIAVIFRDTVAQELPNSLPTSREYKQQQSNLPRPSVETQAVKTQAFQQNVQIELGGVYEILTNNFSPWISLYGQAIWNIDAKTNLYGIVHKQQRFSLDDWNIFLGSYFPLVADKSIVVNLEAAYSPTASVVPRVSVFVQPQFLLTKGVLLNAGYRFNHFPSVNIHLAIPGIEWYIGSFRLTYTLYAAWMTDSGNALSHAAQIQYYFDDVSNIGIIGSFGRENIAIGQGIIRPFDVAGMTLIGRHIVFPGCSVSYELLWQHQGMLFDRFGGRLGIRYTL